MTEMDERHVVIVGGGIAGLAAAYELQERARTTGLRLTLTLLEAEPRVGGKIVTEQVASDLGTFVVEGGPDSFLTQKPWAADLCRRLGLEDELIPTNDAMRAVYVLNRGRLERLPEGMQLIIPTRLFPLLRSPLFTWYGKVRMLMEMVIPPRRSDDDESLASFVGRRFGHEAVEKLAEPLMAGIHAAEPERQSFLGTFARFREMEQKHGSLIRGALAQRRKARATAATVRPPSAFLSLRGGVQRLVQVLEGALAACDLRTGERVSGLERRGDRFRLTCASGLRLDADAVVLATPTYVAGGLLSDTAPELADLLNRIRYVSTVTVSLGFRRDDVEHPLDGFGFVVPRGERRRIFGCTWTSTKFEHRAPERGVLLRCFVGGAGRDAMVDLSDAELIGVARDELRDLMGVDAEPLFSRIFRWHRSNPQYDVGHPERTRRVFELAQEHPGLFLAGSAYQGVGIPDTVRQAQQVAEQVLRYVERRPESLEAVTVDV